jgi:hypothetical protein
MNGLDTPVTDSSRTHTRPNFSLNMLDADIDSAYASFVQDLAKRRDSKTFSNQSSAHAITILRNVFETAERYVDIFSGQLLSSVYNDKNLLEAVKSFVNSREGIVNILLQESIPSHRVNNDGDFLKVMYDLRDKGCWVGAVTENNRLKNASSHFLVADDRMYRIELDPINFNAVCSFQDNSIARKLKKVFDESKCANVKNLFE